MFHIQTKNTIFVTNYGKEYSIADKRLLEAINGNDIQQK